VDDLRGKTVLGTFCHAPKLGAVETLKDALAAVDGAGTIAAVTPAGDPGHAAARAAAAKAGTLVEAPAGSYLLPGFVDLHVHAPQYPQLGKALDVPLEVWLQQYTFPLEARYADLGFARRSYTALVGDLLANGTTTAVYFATVHEDATRLLVDICLEKGQRAFVGKVAMDNPDECPDYYRDASVEAGIDGTRALIDYIRGHAANRGLVGPVVTPRFIPSCTDAMLRGLGALAREHGCHVQTHCSESDWEHGYVLGRYRRSDSEMLDAFGLLTRHTVLAHGNLISPDDMARIAGRGAGVAHCPLSNVYFSDAVFPLRAALAKGVRVGLGTDIAGGPSASLFDSCRMAVAASRMLEDGVDPALPPERRGRPESRVDFRTAFHLATAGGGDVLDLPIGRFAPGCQFDALLIDPAAPSGNLRLWDGLDSNDDALQKLIYGATRANVARVWVAGRGVAG
jgi:guanine deaminase